MGVELTLLVVVSVVLFDDNGGSLVLIDICSWMNIEFNFIGVQVCVILETRWCSNCWGDSMIVCLHK